MLGEDCMVARSFLATGRRQGGDLSGAARGGGRGVAHPTYSEMSTLLAM